MIVIREKKEALKEASHEDFRKAVLATLTKKVRNSTIYYLIGSYRDSDKVEVKMHPRGSAILLECSGNKIIQYFLIDENIVTAFEEDDRTEAGSFKYEILEIKPDSLIFKESHNSRQYLSIKI